MGTLAFQCPQCNKGFKTKEAWSSHAVAKEHGHSCKQCNRWFFAAADLDRHRQDSPAHRTQPAAASTTSAQTITTRPQAPTSIAAIPGAPIVCRGNAYSSLSTAEQDVLYDQLLGRCHTPRRLRSEKYILEGDFEDEYVVPPRRDPSTPSSKRRAVVLDCEMVGTKPGSREHGEVVALSLVDFLTGEVLVDELVRPQGVVTDWRSDITGVTAASLATAAARGRVLAGRPGARARLWEHIDADTVLVGHSLCSDLKSLRMTHARIVDSAVLTAEPVFGRSGTRRLGNAAGLQRLCLELLGLRIRNAAVGIPHDSLEDALATRELVIWCLRNPGMLNSWASRNWGSGRQNRQRRAKRRESTGRWESSDEEEQLRWEDLVDYEIWPKSPPDSD